MDLGNKFGVDERLAEEGVWIDLDDEGGKILVAAASNTHLKRFLEPLYQKYRANNAEIPEKSYEEALARYVLLNWEGITDEGTPIEPTEENRLAMLRKYPPFKALVLRSAVNVANFQQQSDDQGKKK